MVREQIGRVLLIMYGAGLNDATTGRAKPSEVVSEQTDQILAIEGLREEAETYRKMLIEFENIFYLAPNDDAYLRILLKDLYEAVKVGRWARAELGTPLSQMERK